MVETRGHSICDEQIRPIMIVAWGPWSWAGSISIPPAVPNGERASRPP